MGTGTGSAKTRGYTTRARVHSQSRMRNLAIAVRVSIDTAVQYCEVSNQWGLSIPPWAARRQLGGACVCVCVRIRA